MVAVVPALGQATKIKPPVYLYVQQEPQLPGQAGIPAIQAAAQALLVMPPEVLRESLVGNVLTRVTIAPDGTVDAAHIVRHQLPPCAACDSAALRALRSLPRLVPARQEGQPVYFSFPITLTFPAPAKKSK